MHHPTSQTAWFTAWRTPHSADEKMQASAGGDPAVNSSVGQHPTDVLVCAAHLIGLQSDLDRLIRRDERNEQVVACNRREENS